MKERMRHYLLGQHFMDSHHSHILFALDAVKGLSNGHKSFDSLHATSETLSVLQKTETELRGHFLDEEDFMKRINYPYVASHSANHNESMRVFEKAVKHPSGGSLSDLIEELLRHIDFFDRQLVEYCAKTGTSMDEV